MQDVGGNSDGSLLTSGLWSVVAGNDTFYITLNAELTEYNDEWVVTQCNTDLGYAYLEMQSLIYPKLIFILLTVTNKRLYHKSEIKTRLLKPFSDYTEQPINS